MTNHWPAAAHAFPVEQIDEFLVWAAEAGASDIAFQTGETPRMEIDGHLVTAAAAQLDSTTMGALARRIAGESAETVLRGGKPVDCSHAAQTGRRAARRFRVNLSAVQVRHAYGINMSIRILPDAPPTFDELGIEEEIRDAWIAARGLTIVTGVPGSGKSTLLAAGIRRMLEAGVGRIQSYEAPIEFVFDDVAAEGAMMSSSEIPRHFPTFAEGLRASLRRRPAAVIVGEARDRETVEAVVRAADYGIAVYTTAHTIGVAATIRRMVAEFPPDERAERGAALIDQTHLVVTQCLLANPKGGRTALREWLVFTPELKAALLEMPQEAWPRRIDFRVRTNGTSLNAAAVAALEEGRISERDWRRMTASESEG